MSILDFGQFITWLGSTAAEFIAPLTNGLQGKFPVFGTVLAYMVFLWFLEGIGYIVRIIFGWEAAEQASDMTGRNKRGKYQ